MKSRAIKLSFAATSTLIWLTACVGGAVTASPDPIIDNVETAPTLTSTVRVVTEEPSPTPSLDEILALGRDASNSGDWETAIVLYNQVIGVDAAYAAAYHLRGDAHKALGDFTQAISDYDQAIALNSNFSVAHNSRGLAYAEVGDNAQALSDFGRAVEIDTGFGLAYRNRAEVQIIEGHFEAAVLDLQIYLSLVPNALDYAVVQSQITELQGDVAQVVGEDGLLYFDDFSDPSSGWYDNGDPALIAEYYNGGYRLYHPQTQAPGWALKGGRLFSNIRIEVSAEKLSGPNDNYLGVMCRIQGTTGSAKFYLFLLSSDGYYGIAKRVEGDELILIGLEKMQFSDAINIGEDTNIIWAECVDDRLTLYANGTLLIEVFDEDLSSGQIGLMIGTFEEPGTNIVFDDLAVYALEASD